MLRFLTIRFITPIVWKMSKKAKITALKEFSLIEKDSGYQILSTLDTIHDPSYKIHFFNQALEELSHAQMFYRLANSYKINTIIPILERKDILNSKENIDILNFYTYLCIGENSINKQFKWYRSNLLDSKIRKIFKQISEDEEKHGSESLKILQQFSQEKKLPFHSTIIRNRFRYYANQTKQIVNFITEGVLFILLFLIYYSIVPMSLIFIKKDSLVGGQRS